MLLLDTNHLDVLLYGGERCERLKAKLYQAKAHDAVICVVVLEEKLEGWKNALIRNKSASDCVIPYTKLIQIVRFMESWQILPFDHTTAEIYEELRKKYRRAGTKDLRIAATAIQYDAMLLSADRLFSTINELSTENWLLN